MFLSSIENVESRMAALPACNRRETVLVCVYACFLVLQEGYQKQEGFQLYAL